MTKGLTVPPDVRATFVTALTKSSVHAGALPDPLLTGGMRHVFDKAVEKVEITRRGDLNTDQELKILAGKDEKGWFLDYFVVDNDNDGQTFSHGRIREDGTEEAVENYEGQWGRPYFPGDPERTKAERARIDAHNARVTEILRAKGFR